MYVYAGKKKSLLTMSEVHSEILITEENGHVELLESDVDLKRTNVTMSQHQPTDRYHMYLRAVGCVLSSGRPYLDYISSQYYIIGSILPV
jgi:hypothetical protein